MAVAQYFSDFKLGDKCLSDFSGILYNSSDGHEVNVSPNITHVTEKIPNRDGELYFGSTIDSRTINLSIYFEDEVDLQELSAWLCKKELQKFSFVDDDKEIYVIYQGTLDIRCFYNNPFQGLMDLTFIAYDPYYKSVNEKSIVISIPTLNTSYNVKSKGNVDSFPLIKIVPNGTQNKIRVKFNDMIIILQNVTKDIYLDCETEEVYELNAGTKILAMEKFYTTAFYDFPMLLPFVINKVTVLEGGVKEINITPRSRIF